MKLTQVERWILGNQYRLLAELQPENKKDFTDISEALFKGYEKHYGKYYGYVPCEQVLSEDECDEVVDILTMFNEIKRSFARLGEIPGVKEEQLTFKGFDETHEMHLIEYAEYYCNCSYGSLSEFRLPANMNSHMPSLERYRRMLNAWEASQNKGQLTADDVRRIAEASLA